jgi:hypothetical protein
MLNALDRKVKQMLAEAQKPGVSEEERRHTYAIVIVIAIVLAVIVLPILLLAFIFCVNLLIQ